VAAATDGGRAPGRFSARRKTDTILRLLRGESLDSLARELGVTAATLAQWREAFLTGGGQTALKSRPADDRDDEIWRLRDSATTTASPRVVTNSFFVMENAAPHRVVLLGPEQTTTATSRHRGMRARLLTVLGTQRVVLVKDAGP
jgi:transposase-like protein